MPREWTVEQLFRGYLSREELLLTLEDHFREEIVALKEGADRRVQLGSARRYEGPDTGGSGEAGAGGW